MQGLPAFNPRSDAPKRRDEPGKGDDVPCVKCGGALDTGLECPECGHDNYEAVTGKPFKQPNALLVLNVSASTTPSAQADQRIEAELVAAGLTAPRVTADHIQALMDRVVYHYEQPQGTTSTFAHAFLDGFYLASGYSACVSAANFDAAKGQKYAKEQAEPKARDKLWELEGYVLHSKLVGQN